MGTPTITITPQFNPDRFNNEPQTYLVTGSFPNSVLNSYEYIVSASIFTGSVLLVTTSIPSTRSISISLAASGPQTYTLQLTASRDLSFSSEYIQSGSASFYTGVLNKSEPDVPIITYGPALDIQNSLGFILGTNNPLLYSIEQHATGSISFRYNTGSNDNKWEYIPNSLTASIVTGNTTIQYRGISNQTTINHPWTGSMTGSLPVYLSASANYRSPGTLNNPIEYRHLQTSKYTFKKIRSVRFGVWPHPKHIVDNNGAADFYNASASALFNLDNWNNNIINSSNSYINNNRRILFGTILGTLIIPFASPDSGVYVIIVDSDKSIIGDVLSESFSSIQTDTFNSGSGFTANIFYQPSSTEIGYGYKIYFSKLFQSTSPNWNNGNTTGDKYQIAIS